MSGIYEWTSTRQIGREGTDVCYEVVKYSDAIRKQAALVKHGPHSSGPVAYFRDVAEAWDFAERIGLKPEVYSEADR